MKKALDDMASQYSSSLLNLAGSFDDASPIIRMIWINENVRKEKRYRSCLSPDLLLYGLVFAQNPYRTPTQLYFPHLQLIIAERLRDFEGRTSKESWRKQGSFPIHRLLPIIT